MAPRTAEARKAAATSEDARPAARQAGLTAHPARNAGAAVVRDKQAPSPRSSRAKRGKVKTKAAGATRGCARRADERQAGIKS